LTGWASGFSFWDNGPSIPFQPAKTLIDRSIACLFPGMPDPVTAGWLGIKFLDDICRLLRTRIINRGRSADTSPIGWRCTAAPGAGA